MAKNRGKSKSYNARKAYRNYHGNIPDKYHVHHKDGNPYNNSIGNIVALPPSVHIGEHSFLRFSKKRYSKLENLLIQYNHKITWAIVRSAKGLNKKNC